MTFKPAGPIATFILNRFGFDAITSPWNTVYIRKRWIDDETLRRHELAHLAQIKRDGALRFWSILCWDYLVRGYQHSRYEIEAREAEANHDHPLFKGLP